MKKKLFMLFFSTCFVLTALSVGASETQGADDLLHRIYEANCPDSLLNNYTSVSSNRTFFDYDGSTIGSQYTYIDSDLYVQEDSDSNVSILSNGEEYGFDADNGTAFRSLFMDGVYELHCQDLTAELFMQDWEEGQTYTKEEKDGLLTVEVTIDAESMKESNPDAEIVRKMADDDNFIFQYQVDSDSLELQAEGAYFEKSDGSRLEEHSSIMTYDTAEYEPTAELTNAVFGDDFRTVTVIADPGSDQEKTYTQTITKGGQILFYPAEGYGSFYLDADCTETLEEGIDLYADATLYLKQE